MTHPDTELRAHTVVRIGPRSGDNSGKVASVRRVETKATEVDGETVTYKAVTVVIDHPGGRRDLAIERTYHESELTVIAQATASPAARAERDRMRQLAADGLVTIVEEG